MGCCASASAIPPPQAQRRRLSVSNVEDEKNGGGGGGESGTTEEDDRGMLAQLNKEDIISMVAAVEKKATTNGRRFSVGTVMDMGKNSFSNKLFKQQGDASDDQAGLGFTCRKGLKPESANQDSYSILYVEDEFRIYGVYDGHGKQGHDVSQFVKENMQKLIVTDKAFRTPDMPQSLHNNFVQIQSLISTLDAQKSLSATMSGTTATVAIHDLVAKTLTVSHVADSSAVLARHTDASKKKLEAIQLTIDHKPNLPKERARIEAAGGIVRFDGYANHRVYSRSGRYPGLNMSRCLGDLAGHKDAGCSCVPDVSVRPIDDSDHFLLVCSDGVWEFITPDEAVAIVDPYGPDKAMEAANQLASEAWKRWIQEEGGAVVDDITVVLAYLNVKTPE